MGETTSLSLIDKLRQNQPDAWVRLNKLYGPLIRYWCSKQGVRADDIEDIFQEVCHVVLYKVQGFRREKPGDSFRGWLRAITKNTILAHLRKIKKHPQAAGGTNANLRLQGAEAPEDEIDDPPEEQSALALRALALIRSEFSQQHIRAFNLRITQGKPAKEVATELEMTPENVRKVASRMLRRIKQELGDA